MAAKNQDDIRNMPSLYPSMFNPLQDPLDPATQQAGLYSPIGLTPQQNPEDVFKAPDILQAPTLDPMADVYDGATWAKMQGAAMAKADASSQAPLQPQMTRSGVDQGLLSKYGHQMDRSFAEQGTGLDQLGEYINRISARPQGTNWTPIAAFVDSMNPGAHFAQAAQSMAPQSSEAREQTLFNLRNQLQEGKANMAKNQLAAFGDMAKMQQAQKMQELLAGYRGERNDIMRQGLGLRIDDRVDKAQKSVLDDKTLLAHQTRLEGAQRILKTMDEAASGKITMSSQLLADVNKEFVKLLTGGNSALGDLERTEYTSLPEKIAKVRQMLTGEVTDINSPDIIRQVRATVEELREAYQTAYKRRANLMRRDFQHNPEATKRINSKIDDLIAVNGPGGTLFQHEGGRDFEGAGMPSEGGRDFEGAGAPSGGALPEGAFEALDRETGKTAIWSKDKQFLRWK